MDKLEYTALGQTVYRCVLPNGLNIYVDVRPDYGKQFAFFPLVMAEWMCVSEERTASGWILRQG